MTLPVTDIRYHRTREAAPNAHWIVKFLWNQINLQQVSQQVVGKRAGIDPMVLRRWRIAKHEPKMLNVEAVLNVLGYELCVREKKDDAGGNHRLEGKSLDTSSPGKGGRRKGKGRIRRPE